ncbi:MAG: AsmA protein, partial [Oleiphilaceae bacterium]
MNKPIKVTLLCIIGIPLIILSVLLSVFLFKDANDFKSTIEEQAKAQIGLNLKIEDKLSWSLIPIGIEVNKLRILDQSEAPFASADKIVASIDFWSLFKGSPKVETILLDGLKLELIQVSDTENNWSKILPPKSEEQSESLTTKAPQTEAQSDGEKSPLNFLIESFQLINTDIRFESITQAIQLEIKNLNLSLSQITLGETFPLTVSYSLSEAKNQINIDSTLKANLFASKDLTKFTLSNVQNSYEVNAPNISSKTIKLNLASNVDIDTKAESVDISSLMISLNNLTLKGQAEIRNYSKDLSLNSEIDIPNFSLKGLLSSLSISLPEMQNKEALESVSLSSSIRLENKSLNLKDILINLDKSSWKADVSHSLESTASKIRIKGDKINLDSYLPPTNDKEANDSGIEGKNTETVKTETNQPLLPIETLQKLNLDFELEQDSLSVKNIETTKLVVALFAKDGKLTQTLKGNLFEGSYSSKSTIDVHSKKPLWASEQSIKDLNLSPIFDTLNIEVLKEYGNIAGLLNLSAKTNMSGNDLNTLKSSATSDLEFHIDQGSFEGLSLNALVCKGFALINKEAVDTSTWPNTTPFNTLKGSASLKQQILDTRFDLITSGIHADSKGSIDISKNNINILASLKVIGDLGDNACRVNKKVTKIGIPVKCQGAFDTPPAELCKLDTSRLGDMAKDLAIEEGTRKAKKEIDRALDKHLGDKKEALKSI